MLSALLDLRLRCEDVLLANPENFSPSTMKILRLRPMGIQQSTLPRKTSKVKYEKTVP
jgi:hypothetical protein